MENMCCTECVHYWWRLIVFSALFSILYLLLFSCRWCSQTEKGFFVGAAKFNM